MGDWLMEVFMFISAILLALFIGSNLYLSRLLDKKDTEIQALSLMHTNIIRILRNK